MLRDTAVTLIKGRLANNKLSGLDALIVAEMVLFQAVVMEGDRTKFWFLETLDKTLATVVDQDTLDLADAANYLTETDRGGFWWVDSDGNRNEIRRGDYDDMVELYGSDTGSPKRYAIVGSTVYLFPTPDDVYTIWHLHYSREDSLESANIENAWLKYAPDWMIGGVGEIIARQYNNDEKMAQKFSEQAQQARARLVTEHTAREEANRLRLNEVV